MDATNFKNRYRRLIFIIMKEEIINYLNTEESRKKLRLLYYLSSQFGDPIIQQDVSVYSGGDTDWYYYPVILDNGHVCGSNLQGHLPKGVNEFLHNFFEMVINDCLDNTEYDSDNYHRFDFVLDLPKKRLTVDMTETIINTEDRSYVRDKDDLLEDNQKELIDYFENLLSNEGREVFTVSFNGSGDSGFIDSDCLDTNTNVSFPINGILEDYLYRFLSYAQPGWEINEGSQGDFVINTKQKEISLELGVNYEDYKSYVDVYTIDFKDIQF